MCKVQSLRTLVNDRLNAVVEEIFVVLERTIAEYEEELSRTKDENERQRQLLDAVFKPQLVLSKGVREEELPPEQQEGSSRAEHEKPQMLHIKEEEQVWAQEEADISRFPVTCVNVKSEDEAQRPLLHHSLGEAKRRSEPDGFLAPLSDCDDTSLQSPDTDNGACQADMTCHALNKQYTCSHCDKTFNSKSHLKKHRQCHAVNKHVKCPQCDKTFVSKSTLKTHMRCHTGEKPFSCSFCSKKFSQKGNLLKHTRTHTGERPFSCSSCTKSFCDRSALAQHHKTHTGEKPFACSVCGQQFSMKANMMTHTRTHTGEKPFACSVCGLRVAQKIHLTIHMRRHTGEKPFCCSFCDKRFFDGSSLVQHTKTHTGEKLISCKICNKRFTRKFQFHHHKCADRKQRRP
ncbi:zinc finger protein OZF-like isoform X2 [Nerophis ophidion]|uniref:zinc finger protein OZF-like isoform X2 n=1 Tax=Nerophis ophidion TaxID=159077 RepID=UPI002ADF43CB|nr:zinc finger protein OZF-like isoform X2 [Nerophis ophidion]